MALRRPHQSFKRAANRRIIDRPAHPARLGKRDAAEKGTARLTRFARSGVDDVKIGVRQ
jgi:hypothetical protein